MTDIATAVPAFIDALSNNARKIHDHVHLSRYNPVSMENLSMLLESINEDMNNALLWLRTLGTNQKSPHFHCHLMMSINDVFSRISRLQDDCKTGQSGSKRKIALPLSCGQKTGGRYLYKWHRAEC